jgi:hypothetical protein
MLAVGGGKRRGCRRVLREEKMGRRKGKEVQAGK